MRQVRVSVRRVSEKKNICYTDSRRVKIRTVQCPTKQCCGAGAGRSQPFLVGAGSRSRPSQGAGAGADQNFQNLGSSLKIT